LRPGERPDGKAKLPAAVPTLGGQHRSPWSGRTSGTSHQHTTAPWGVTWSSCAAFLSFGVTIQQQCVTWSHTFSSKPNFQKFGRSYMFGPALRSRSFRKKLIYLVSFSFLCLNPCNPGSET